MPRKKKGDDYTLGSLPDQVGALLSEDDPKLVADRTATAKILARLKMPDDQRCLLVEMIGLQDFV